MTVERPLFIGHGGHPKLFQRLDALQHRYLEAGTPREARGVMAAMWEIRGYFADYLDIDLRDTGPASQFGDLPE